MSRYRNSLGYKVYIAPAGYQLARSEGVEVGRRYLDYLSNGRPLFSEFPPGFDTYSPEQPNHRVPNHPWINIESNYSNDNNFRTPFTLKDKGMISHDVSGFAISDDYTKLVIYGRICTVLNIFESRSVDTGTSIGVYNHRTGAAIVNHTSAGPLERNGYSNGTTNIIGPIHYNIHLDLDLENNRAKVLSFSAKSLSRNYFTRDIPTSNVTWYETGGKEKKYGYYIQMNVDMDKTLSEPSTSTLNKMNVTTNDWQESIIVVGNNEASPAVGNFFPASTLYVDKASVLDMIPVAKKILQVVWSWSGDQTVYTIPSDIIRYRPYDGIYTNGINTYNDLKQAIASARL